MVLCFPPKPDVAGEKSVRVELAMLRCCLAYDLFVEIEKCMHCSVWLVYADFWIMYNTMPWQLNHSDFLTLSIHPHNSFELSKKK